MDGSSGAGPLFLTEAGKLAQFVQRPCCGLRATGFINLCAQVAYVKVGLLQAGYWTKRIVILTGHNCSGDEGAILGDPATLGSLARAR